MLPRIFCQDFRPGAAALGRPTREPTAQMGRRARRVEGTVRGGQAVSEDVPGSRWEVPCFGLAVCGRGSVTHECNSCQGRRGRDGIDSNKGPGGQAHKAARGEDPGWLAHT